MLVIVIIGLPIFFGLGIYGFILPAIKQSKRMLSPNFEKETYPIQVNEILFLVVVMSLGYGSLCMIKTEFELLDWDYISSLWLYAGISILFYFISRRYKYHSGPLLLVIIPSALGTGIILFVVEFIHLFPMALLGGVFFPFTFFALPIFALAYAVILLSVELYCVLQLNKSRFKERENKGLMYRFLHNLYFGRYAVLAQVLTFPLFITLVQCLFMLLGQEPDDIIKTFTESHDGLFGHGRCQDCVSYGNSEYICTIAAFGSPKLVRPIHIGHRHGQLIKVTRQLKVCNAFEEMLIERAPKTQKVLRKFYDDLQIPIEKWSKVKTIANVLYILIKPMEWTFLFTLYLLEKEPEKRIAKQYRPVY